MNPTGVGLLVVTFFLTVGLLSLWRQRLRRQGEGLRQKPDEVYAIGYSPILSWLKRAWQNRRRAPAPNAEPQPLGDAVLAPMPAPLVEPMAAPITKVDAAPLSEMKAELPPRPVEQPQPPPLPVATKGTLLAPSSYGWVLLGALGLAAFGQWTLLYGDSDNRAPGVICYGVAMVMFAWLAGRVEPPAAAPRYVAAPLVQRLPAATLWLVSLALCYWTVQNVNAPEMTTALARVLAVTWVLSIVVFVWSVLQLDGWPWPGRAALRQWWRAHWGEVLILLAMVALALVIRLYNLELEPYAIANDEGEHGTDALLILSGARSNFFDLAYGSQVTWALVPRAIAIQIFGNTVFGLRVVSALEGTLSLVFLYLLGREIFNRELATLACLLAVALPWYIQFSRLGVTCSGMLLYSTLVVWLTYRALRLGRVRDYLWAGIVTGLTIYTYVGARVIGGLAVGTLAYVALRQRGYLKLHLRHWFVLVVGAAIVMAPEVAWYWAHASSFSAQMNGHAILSNGWLEAEAATRPGGMWAALEQQFAATTLVYIATPATEGFFQSPAPYLVSIAAVFFMLGLGYSLSRLKDPRYITVLAWLGGTVLAGTLTDLPPASERLILSAPAVALLVALGLQKAVSVAKNLGRLPAKWASPVCFGLILIVGAQNLNFYLNVYVGQHCYTNRTQEVTYEAGLKAASLGPAYRMYLIGDGVPQVFAVFANFHYLAPEANTTNFNTVSAETLAALPRTVGAFFTAVPSRRADLEMVARLAPGGQWFEVNRRYVPGELLYLGYVLTPEQFSRR